jgi:hypothetical protein
MSPTSRCSSQCASSKDSPTAGRRIQDARDRYSERVLPRPPGKDPGHAQNSDRARIKGGVWRNRGVQSPVLDARTYLAFNLKRPAEACLLVAAHQVEQWEADGRDPGGGPGPTWAHNRGQDELLIRAKTRQSGDFYKLAFAERPYFRRKKGFRNATFGTLQKPATVLLNSN